MSILSNIVEASTTTCIKFRRFDDNMDQNLNFLTKNGSKFEFFDDNLHRNLNFSTTTRNEL